MRVADGSAYRWGTVTAWEPGHFGMDFTLAQDADHPSRLDVWFEPVGERHADPLQPWRLDAGQRGRAGAVQRVADPAGAVRGACAEGRELPTRAARRVTAICSSTGTSRCGARCPADVADVREVYSEADTRRWMLWDDELPDDAEALANIERSEQAWAEGSWAVFRIVVDEHVVGGVNLRFAEYDTAETSYFLRASARGRGLATRAVLLAADWGFRERGLARVFLRVNPENAVVGGAGGAGRLHVRGRGAAVGGRPGRAAVRLPRLLAAAGGAGVDPTGHARRRRLPHRHRDRGHPRTRAASPPTSTSRSTAPASSSGPRSRCAARCRTARPRSSRRTASRSAGCASYGPRRSSSSPACSCCPPTSRAASAPGSSATWWPRRGRPARRFELSVEKDNVRAQALYERLGMVRVGETDHDLLLRLV